MTWIRPADLPPMICREWSPLVCSWFLSLQFFLRNNDLFICGHPNQDVGGELILDCKVEDLKVLHEYFRPRGCIKYCLWEDKTLDHVARVKELMGLDESRETSRTQCGWQPWWNQPLYRLWDLNALCINYCAPATARTVHSEFFLWTNKIPRLVFIPSDAVCSWTMHRIAPKQHIGHRWSTSPITQHSTTSRSTFWTWRPSRNSSGICARRK